MGIGEVGSQLGYLLHLAQTLLEKCLRFCKGLAVLSCFLLGDELRIGAYLRLYVFAVHQVAYLMYEEVVGIAVAHQMVDVAVEIQVLLGADDGEAEEAVLG